MLAHFIAFPVVKPMMCLCAFSSSRMCSAQQRVTPSPPPSAPPTPCRFVVTGWPRRSPREELAWPRCISLRGYQAKHWSPLRLCQPTKNIMCVKKHTHTVQWHKSEARVIRVGAVCVFIQIRATDNTRTHTTAHYLDHYFDFFVYTTSGVRVLFICQPRELGHIGGESARVGLINLNCAYFPYTNKNNTVGLTSQHHATFIQNW